MRVWFVAALLALASVPAAAQPADCARTPTESSGLPLSIDLAGRPGVPNGFTGQAYLQVPTDSAGGYACDDAPPPPRDILRGAPGDVLRGAPSSDLLRGPGAPRVEVEVLPK
ncbi:MAG TPA: hypothetical protein VLI93_13035 [Acetobacteraceae bacterium]|nr:hypothetical protein [Acetobacteraceae bacterium]